MTNNFNKDIIETLDKVLEIQANGRVKRLEAEKELVNIEQEFNIEDTEELKKEYKRMLDSADYKIILTDAFGIVAVAAAVPVICIQLVGLLYKAKLKHRFGA